MSDASRLPRALVIEPSPVRALIMTRLAEQAGYQARVVGNPGEALSALEETAFDAVLLDASRPDHGTFATRLRDRYPGLAIVAMVPEEATRNLSMAGEPSWSAVVRPSQGAAELRQALARATPSAAGAAEIVEQPAFDRRRLVHNLGDDEDAARRVLDQFSRQSQAMLADLREACRTGELGLVEQTAHRLKGSLLWIAAERAAAVAATMESLATAGETERARQVLASLEREVGAVVAAILGTDRLPAV